MWQIRHQLTDGTLTEDNEAISYKTKKIAMEVKKKLQPSDNSFYTVVVVKAN